MSDFTTDDEYQKHWMQEEATRLALVISARRNSPAKTAEQMIRELDARWCKALAGKSFTLTFDAEGRAHVDERES
jgi:hypothetical protein